MGTGKLYALGNPAMDASVIASRYRIFSVGHRSILCFSIAPQTCRTVRSMDENYILTACYVVLDGRVPRDRSQVKHEPRIIAPELFVVFSTAASIGIVLGIVFLVFNRYYRKYK